MLFSRAPFHLNARSVFAFFLATSLLIGACDTSSPLHLDDSAAVVNGTEDGGHSPGEDSTDAGTNPGNPSDGEDAHPDDSTKTSPHEPDAPDSTGTAPQEPSPCAVSSYFPLESGQMYVYDYAFTSNGGQGSGEDRAHGTLTWTVTGESCTGSERLLTIDESLEGLSEYRTFVGENQDWQRRDTISTSTVRHVSMSDKLYFLSYYPEAIPWPPAEAGSDTVMFAHFGAKESYTLVFVVGQGLVEARHWEMQGLGGPSETTTITLVGRGY